MDSTNMKEYCDKHGEGEQVSPTDAASAELLRLVSEMVRIQDYPGAGKDRVA